jgi:menaquinone-dependent protoporphyrinogen oxidase
MKIALIYASKYGTTEKVAGLIADKLKDSNETTLIPLKDNPNPDISGFEFVILGTPIYANLANRKMKTFCATNETALLQKRTGLFVCGMEPDPTKRAKELEDAYSVVLRNEAKATGFLGGAFIFEQMNFAERFIIKKIAKTDQTVHHILQDEIDDFVRKI